MLAEILRDRITSGTRTKDESTIENSYNLRHVRSCIRTQFLHLHFCKQTSGVKRQIRSTGGKYNRVFDGFMFRYKFLNLSKREKQFPTTFLFSSFFRILFSFSSPRATGKSACPNWFPNHFWPDVFSSFDDQRSRLALELVPVGSKHPIRIIERRRININAAKPFTDPSTACSTNGRSGTDTILRVFLDAYRIEQLTDNGREHRSDS